ncbi:nucleotide sugar dehydrogenase [Candidatus Shapirobacteria bacterium CG09_land_8_20_14_0_10_49_15]|uniref:Nucleotide sugar dehydrogenase n=1 Tax=Candidatus Shapirobacteria bacterium CG09_land_8_20_14_0_10_49_15 TaxID=1974482 RepID=A0A2M6XAT1_9BACT|nr:MAG: nucleotide sugar dehydrogenase [Candidatus Shapirobacteria bacterium CG09_land_8_20_14_0_10_49_15]
MKSVAIIGIGRVGLPLGLAFAESGHKVYGVDIRVDVLAQLNKGEMPFIEKGALPLLKKHLHKKFVPTADYSTVKNCDYIVLTLGTPVDENMNPSMAQIDSALNSLKEYFRPRQTLILRSTVYPGTTQYVKFFLNKIKNIQVGKNFYLAFCPERIAEGKAIEELREIPQIIGGIDKVSAKKAIELFKAFKITCLSTDDLSAELAKLFTNMYRYISFAIANEFMVIASSYHRDIYEIVRLVNQGYKRGGLAVPGFTAGPCLFKDGFFLINDLPFADLISTSWKVNEAIPLFLVNKIRQRMKLENKKTVVLGLAFKANIDDTRESLSAKVIKALERERAQVFTHDPLIKEHKDNLDEKLKDADLVFIATPHNWYRQNLPAKKIQGLVKKNCLICDIWNIFATNKIIFSLNGCLKSQAPC